MGLWWNLAGYYKGMTARGDQVEEGRVKDIESKIPQPILFLAKITKVSNKNKENNRVIAITNTSLYHLEKTTLDRTVRILSVEGISISLISTEFTLHIPSEFDMRFRSPSRDAIVSLLLKNRHSLGEVSKIPLFLSREERLESVTTTEEDAKKNKIKSLESEYRMVCHKSFRYELARYVNSQPNTEILYASEDCPSDLIEKNYKKIMKIGESQVCQVEVIKCSKDGTVFAMKSFSKRHLSPAIDRFRQIIANYVPHIYLEKLMFVKEKESVFQLFFEYYSGDLYGQLKAQHTLDEPLLFHLCVRMLVVIAEVNYALTSLHPENILVDSHGSTYLSLFSSHFNCQTPDEYWSPEEVNLLMKGIPIKHPRMVSMWRLGVTLYELAFGVPPFPLIEIVSSVVSNQQLQLHFPKASTSKYMQLFLQQVLKSSPEQRLNFSEINNAFNSEWLKGLTPSKYLTMGKLNLREHIVKIQIEDNYCENIEYYFGNG